MTLLLYPTPGDAEGPLGYRMRVAEANLLSFRDVSEAPWHTVDDGDETTPIVKRWRTLQAGPAIWIHRRARWCPGCLALHGQGRIGWELLFADACAGCGHWLLDACHACAEPVTWRRDALLRCACGADLCDQPSRLAPDAVVRLSRSMEQLALGLPGCDLPHLQHLSVSQCSRLVRVLGAYGSSRHQRSPQKIVGADTMDVSWTISSVAGEILANWPAGFHAFLARQSNNMPAAAGRMPGVFGGVYRALYKGLQEPEFDWVRRAFEDFVAEHWTGAIGRRNRRLPEAVLARLAWLPASEAASMLGISSRRLEHLIESGQVTAKRRTSAAGREFVMVRRQDALSLLPDAKDDITLAAAASLLGLKRQRLGRLLTRICPAAIKLTLQGTPWVIPRGWVDGWLSRVSAAPLISEPPPKAVPLDFLLRYGPLDDQAVADLLNDIAAGKVEPIGRLQQGTGVASLLLDRKVVEAFRRSGQAGLSAPEAAERLGVKQEVVYALIRAGLLVAEQQSDGRRKAAFISESSLSLFCATYIFATEIARSLRTSPKAVARALSNEGVEPVAGPGLGNCRQVVYARSQLFHLTWLCL